MARSSSSRRAFSLVEILLCIVILVSLAAIAASVLRPGRHRGSVKAELSQLHQIGLAANLYHEEGDAWPMNTTALVNSGYIPKDVCYSPRDQYPIGWANRYLTANAQQASSYAAKLATFPNSYLSIFDTQFPANRLKPIMTEQKGLGLFVSLIESSNLFPNESPTGPFKGTYRRVLLDGSVQKRWHISMKGPDRNGKTVTMMADVTWFFDPDDRWKQEFLITD